MSDLHTEVRALLDVLHARRMRFLGDDAPVIAAAVERVEKLLPKDQRADNA